MLNEKYEKFLKTVKNYDLIPADTDKIVIATSGGKDANVLTVLLNEYKKREHPSLELELVTAPIPSWKYYPEQHFGSFDDERKNQILVDEAHYIKVHKEYWESQGIPFLFIDRVPGIDDQKIYDSTNPCVWCFVATRQAFYKYIEEQSVGKKVLLATGLTKWDVMYVLLSQLLRTGGKDWQTMKNENPERYRLSRMHLATFSPYPKINIGIPNRTAYRITPLIEFNDIETRALSKELDLPIIPDICVDFYGEKFLSDKRHFDRFVLNTAKEEMNVVDTDSPLFSNYGKLISVFQGTGTLPPLKELDGFLYEAYNKQLMTAVVKDH